MLPVHIVSNSLSRHAIRISAESCLLRSGQIIKNIARGLVIYPDVFPIINYCLLAQDNETFLQRSFNNIYAALSTNDYCSIFDACIKRISKL